MILRIKSNNLKQHIDEFINLPLGESLDRNGSKLTKISDNKAVIYINDKFKVYMHLIDNELFITN